MLQDCFEQYLRSKSLSESSINKYIGAIIRINRYLEDYDFSIKDLFSIASIYELELVKSFLRNNNEFIEQDSRGNSMYSVAFKHFYRFIHENYNDYISTCKK